MDVEFPAEDRPLDAAWIAPLEAVERTVRSERRYRFFDVHDFMIMGRLIRRNRPNIVLYKHYYTRRYLNLDDAGHAYRYVAPRSLNAKSDGRYVAHHDLRAALDALGLWELPWMKEGLESFRDGRSWDDRWDLHPDVASSELGSTAGEDRLRLV